jgi:hypothetical protein
VYRRHYGAEPNWRHWSPPSTALDCRVLAMLARRNGIKRLSVWPAPLPETPPPAGLRDKLGPAPFRKLAALVTHVRLASVAWLLLLVPQVAVLGLYIVDKNVAGQESVLHAVAEHLPQLCELTVRFGGPFTLDADVLLALSRRGALTVLDLRTDWHTKLDTLALDLSRTTWKELSTRLPRLELPHECKVLNGNAVSIAGLCC